MEEHSFEHPYYTTVFHVELVAILKAMEEYGSKYESFSLFGHSMSLLMALSNPSYDDPLVADIHESRVGLEVKWYWIKAHIGGPG